MTDINSKLTKRVPFHTVVFASIVKDIRKTKKYIPDLMGLTIQLLVRVAFFLFLSGIVTYTGTNILEGKDLFIFFSSAFLMFIFFSTALWQPLSTIQSDLYNGTLEYLYTNPVSRYAYFVGTTLASAIINLVFFIPLFVFLVIFSNVDFNAVVFILAVCSIGIIISIALGVMISFIGLLWKQVNSIIGVLAMLFEFIGGAYAPVHEFPVYVKVFAYLLPYTWGYDLVRFYLMGGKWQTLFPVWIEWIIFTGMAVVYTALSLLFLAVVENKVKEKGLNLL
jgi:ABC-2 type transport system permease protein